jgi:tRNA pseudouridine55 synthase
MADDDKTYCATALLGQSTDTLDATGQPTSEHVHPTFDQERVREALAAFLGPIEQVPPAYSAIKQGGQPLYRLARAGKDVQVAPRKVTIHEIELLAWDPPEVTFRVRCSKGTYVRSLAHDLGQRLGCGGHLKALVRTASGAFRLEDATSLEELAAAFAGGYVEEFAYAPDEAALHLPAVVVSDQTETLLRNGSRWQGPSAEAATTCRAFTTDGRLAAILENEDGSALWRPRKVLSLDA